MKPGRGFVRTLLVALLALNGCAGSAPKSKGTPSGVRGETVPVESASAGSPSHVETAKVEVGKPFIDFTALTSEGVELRLSRVLESKPVVLQFWGVRCGPCLAEMAVLSELQRRLEGRIQVLGVNTDRIAAAALRQALSARRIAAAYPLVADPDFMISQHYTQWLVPLTVLIDRKGSVRAVHTGFSETLKAELVGQVEALAREGG